MRLRRRPGRTPAWMLAGMLMVCGLAASAQAGQSYAKAQVSRSQVNLGDELLYTVEVMTAGNSQAAPVITLPDLSAQFQVQDVFTRSSVNILNGKTYLIYFKELHLVANHTGEISIAPSRVQFFDPQTRERFDASTEAVSVRVNEATGVAALPTATPEIGVLRPIKAQARITLTQFLPFGIGLLLLGAVTGTYVYVRKRPAPAPPAPVAPVDPRTPEQRALEALEAARKLKRPDQANAFYTALSAILRRYLAEAHHFLAEEMTTSELLEEMERREFLGDFLKQIRPYLDECDLIKFANQPPAPAALDSADVRARQLILEPKKKPEPAPAPAAAPGPGDGTS